MSVLDDLDIPGTIVPVDIETTAILCQEIRRLRAKLKTWQEWRDARLDIFAAADEGKTTGEMWRRLGNAESALMQANDDSRS